MENLSFDQAMSKLEEILKELEAENNKLTPEQIEAKISEAEALRDHCRELLKKEKAEIIKTAKDNNIPLSDLGMSEDEEDFDDDDEDDEDDDEDEEK